MLRETKMQGAGNDFVVIDALNQPFCPDSDTIRALCDRHYGIGADQCRSTYCAEVVSEDY